VVGHVGHILGEHIFNLEKLITYDHQDFT